MPANLSPEYRKLDARLRETRDPDEKLLLLKQMLTVIPKHKGTDKMQADLKRRISRQEHAAEQKGKKSGRDLFHVPREGAGQVALVGAPNAGKSSVLAKVTRATPQIAPHPYATHLPLPGMVQFEDVQVQLIDTPPLSREYTETPLYNVFRVSDLLLLIVDLTAPDPSGQLLDCLAQLEEHHIEPSADAPRGAAGNLVTVKKPAIILANKVDCAGREAAEDLEASFGEQFPLRVVSAETGEGLEELPRLLFDELHLIRVYTKRPGRKFERGMPFVVAGGSTVMDAARVIHKDFAEKMRFTRLWGSGKHQGLSVPRDHTLEDGDILEIHTG